MVGMDSVPQEKPKGGRFDIGGLGSEKVKAMEFEFVGRGGESLVYRSPSQPGLVAKANKAVLAEYIKRKVLLGESPADATVEDHRMAEAHIRREAERVRKLAEYFGPMALRQKKVFVQVPLTDEILKEIGADGYGAKESWTIVTLQRSAHLLSGGQEEKYSLTGGYAETRSLRLRSPSEVYKRVNRRLIFLQPNATISHRDFIEVQASEQLRGLLERAQDDMVLHGVMSDFVERAVAYSNETGEILDLAGHDNVLIGEVDGEWKVEVIDALYPDAEVTVSSLCDILDGLAAGKEITHDGASALLNTVNYVRTVNGLADELGLDSRVHLPRHSLRWQDVDVQGAILKGMAKKRLYAQ